jgi:hypothetical protein
MKQKISDSLISIINPEFKSNLQIKLRPSGFNYQAQLNQNRL